MNFEQAQKYAFLVKWKVAECFSGSDCWCRIIVPVEPILYKVHDREEEYEVIRDGSIDKETAEYIVKLHNEHYERVKQSCRDAMKDIEFIKLDLSEEQKESFKKEYDKLNTGPRSIEAIEMTDSIIPWTHKGVTLKNNPTIDDFRIIKRKEID